MSEHAAILDQLSSLLPKHMSAHEVLGAHVAADPDGQLQQYVYVQGRRDRLHVFATLEGVQTSDDLLTSAAANWRWIVCTPDQTSAALDAARRVRAGVVEVAQAALAVRLRAPANPGIFMKKYPQLAENWSKISSW